MCINVNEIMPALRLPAEVQNRVDAAMVQFDRHSALPDPDDRRDPRAAHFHKHSRSETTRNAYRFFLGIFFEWCQRVGRRDAPATASTLEAFATYLAYEWIVQRGKNRGQRGMAPASIRLALSAVRTWHRVQGYDPPDSGLASGVVSGHERLRATNPDIEDGKGAPPLQLPTLVELFGVCDPLTVAGLRDRALLSIGWALMARRSELSRLQIVNVGKPDRNGIKVFIARSKTDQLGEGVTILIPWMPALGELCPVTCAQGWQGCLDAHGVSGGGFLRGVDKHGHINGAPGWGGPRQSEYLDPTAVEWVINRACLRAMLPEHERFTAHSLRSGGATDLYLAGVDILRIARQGRWGDRSPVVFKYIRDAPDWENNALALANFERLLRK